MSATPYPFEEGIDNAYTFIPIWICSSTGIRDDPECAGESNDSIDNSADDSIDDSTDDLPDSPDLPNNDKQSSTSSTSSNSTMTYIIIGGVMIAALLLLSLAQSYKGEE